MKKEVKIKIYLSSGICNNAEIMQNDVTVYDGNFQYFVIVEFMGVQLNLICLNYYKSLFFFSPKIHL